MLARIPPGALRRRSGYVAIAAVLAGSLYVASGQTPVSAAARDVSASAPPMALMLAMTKANEKSAAPAVDVIYKSQHNPRYPVAALQQGETIEEFRQAFAASEAGTAPSSTAVKSSSWRANTRKCSRRIRAASETASLGSTPDRGQWPLLRPWLRTVPGGHRAGVPPGRYRPGGLDIAAVVPH